MRLAADKLPNVEAVLRRKGTSPHGSRRLHVAAWTHGLVAASCRLAEGHGCGCRRYDSDAGVGLRRDLSPLAGWARVT